jgi:putative transcriptional regulator
MPKAHKSLKGQLLLDGGQLAGSWFHRTVVLVCEHNAEGAFGLVLTKASDSRVEDVLEGEFGERIGGLTLYGGGPVQPAALSFLRGINQVGEPLAATQRMVIPGLAVGHQLEDLVELAQPTPVPPPVRVFAGYAGWSPGQLDAEMERGSWLVEPATLDWIFVVSPEDLWRQILKQRAGWQERLLADSPEDTSWN